MFTKGWRDGAVQEGKKPKRNRLLTEPLGPPNSQSPPPQGILGMTECDARWRPHVRDARVARGTGSTCEKRDNCPTVSYQKYSSTQAWDKQCKQFISENSNQCVHPEVPTGTLTKRFTATPRPPTPTPHVVHPVDPLDPPPQL